MEQENMFQRVLREINRPTELELQELAVQQIAAIPAQYQENVINFMLLLRSAAETALVDNRLDTDAKAHAVNCAESAFQHSRIELVNTLLSVMFHLNPQPVPNPED